MVYVYDILLNFNKELIEFFEWNDNDSVKFIRKIPLLRVTSKTLNDFINNNISIDADFLVKIKCSSDFYDEALKIKYKYIAVLSDTKMSLAINIENNKLKEVSRLLLDEEFEILNLSSNLEITNIDYQILNPKNIKKTNLTRTEQHIKDELSKELSNLFNDNHLEKLKFYYYEYFNKIENDKNKLYKALINSLNDFNDKHLNLYNIIKLSYQNK